MLKKEGITDQKKLSLMFPNSVNYLDKLEMLIGRTDGGWPISAIQGDIK